MQEPKVSIIVPVYNTSPYLHKCIDSLLDQTLREIEIICIDDGSTDDSPAILDEYARHDRRVRVEHRENAGYGATMNRGIELATGEYIGICESDDFASRKMFSTLYRYAQKHYLDIVKSNYYEHRAGKDVRMRPFDPYPYWLTFDPEEVPEIIRVLPCIWAAIYRREMIKGYNIRFNETPGAAFQDTYFLFQTWMCARRVALLSGAFLHYRVDNQDSSSHSTSKVFDVCYELESDEEYLQSHPEKIEVFGGVLQSVKYATYRWNWNRIADEYREAFAERMATDLGKANGRGELKECHFTKREWAQVQELLADPHAFAEAHKKCL